MRIDNPNIRLLTNLSDGKRVLLNEITITEQIAASLDFLLPVGYDHHEILIRDLRGTNDDVQVIIQLGDPINEFNTSDYDWVLHRSSLAGNAVDTLEGDSGITMVPTTAALGLGNGANEGFNAEVVINNVQNVTMFCNLHWRAAYMDASVSTDVSHTRGSGQLAVLVPVDRMSIVLSNGNFTSGKVSHYGIVGGGS